VTIKQSAVEPHWNYFLSIERDLEVLSRFIEFDTRNFACFSIEIARILLAAGAEVDVVCQQVCKRHNAKSKAENIVEYQTEITKALPGLVRFHVIVPRYGLDLRPWVNWSEKKTPPFWWTAYNKTKHERNAQYHRANLQNALNAVAGLFVMVLHLYPERGRLGELIPSPVLLRPGPAHAMGVAPNGAIAYNLQGN
jgi:hypothetical protein